MSLLALDELGIEAHPDRVTELLLRRWSKGLLTPAVRIHARRTRAEVHDHRWLSTARSTAQPARARSASVRGRDVGIDAGCVVSAFNHPRSQRLGDSARSQADRRHDRGRGAARAHRSRAPGVAHITKRPTPVRVVSVTKGRVSGFFERSPGVDYCGTLRGGRAVFVEVKSCHEGTFPLREIEPEQWAEMARALDLGAVCALVVRWQPPTDKGRALLEGRSFAWCIVPW